jgi:hypothetical protein
LKKLSDEKEAQRYERIKAQGLIESWIQHTKKLTIKGIKDIDKR